MGNLAFPDDSYTMTHIVKGRCRVLAVLLAVVVASGLPFLALDRAAAQVPVIVEVDEEGSAPGAPSEEPSGEAPGVPGSLPRTGMDVIFAVSLALFLIGGGTVLIDATRRSEQALRGERKQT